MRMVLVVLGVLLLPSSGRADDVESRIAQAKLHYDTGMAHYQLEEWDAAIGEFEAGFRLRPSPEFLFNIGQSYRLSKRPDKAVVFYQKYLRMQPDAPNRADVERFIERARQDAQSQPQPPPTPTVSAPEPTVAPATPSLIAQAPAKKPVYKRGWFWGVVGGAVVLAAGAVVIGIVVGGDSTRTLPLAKF